MYSILGINKRNLAYIKKLNPQKHIRLADNKYKMKLFLEQRWIPVPKTYKYITDRKELLSLDFGSLPSNVFVAKPNKWSKGKWIFILKRLDTFISETSDSRLTRISSWIDDYFYKDIPTYPYGYEYKWSVLSDMWLKKKLVPILEWNYTLANRLDTILIEEKILPGWWFEQFCEYGLADIRIIVCNLVPVAAMLRMPTKESWWVANIAQWGMALGIDIATGQIRTLATRDKIYYDTFPDEYKHFYKYVIPFWDDVLLHSANIQYFINMWYVWLDWVITADGPKLLEVNGKAWLEIQNIAGIPLQKILYKISDLDITTPQKWIEVARSLFAPVKDSSIPQSKILYLSQKWVLSLIKGNDQQDMDVVIATKPNKKRNYTSLDIVDAVQNSDYVHMKIGNTILKDMSLYGSDRIQWHRIELWSNTLKNYYIRPIHKSHANIHFISPGNLLEAELDDLMILDKKLQDVAKKLPLLKLLFPSNYLDQFDKFISYKWKYNPIFTYNFPKYKEITLWRTQLKQLRDEYSGSRLLESRFAQLFYHKFDEVENKLNLIYAYKKQDYESIRTYNERLFGMIDDEQVLQSQNLMHFRDKTMYQESLKIGMLEMRNIIDSVFKKYGVKKYKIQLTSSLLWRISFLNATIPTIKLDPNFRWTKRELLWQLEHEIGVHLQRAKNGKKTKWSILQKWTAGYLPTEEWLAIYQAQKVVQEFFPHFYNAAIHRKYVFVDFSEKMSFMDIVSMLQDIRSHQTLKSLFRQTVRLKRWTKDTSLGHAWTTFLKDKVYLDGYKKVSSRLVDGWDIDRLMIGKIKIEDLDYI